MTTHLTPAYRREEFGHPDDSIEIYDIPAQCGGCYVQVQYWANGFTDPQTLSISLVSDHWNPSIWNSWREKFRTIRSVLKGIWTGYSIEMTTQAEVQALIDVLEKHKGQLKA